jgi:DNA uptake protein ComE-like DNA-binding protein
MRVLSFFGAMGAGVFAGAWLAAWQRRRGEGRGTVVDINQASMEELMKSLGLDAATADRIVEHRPYPSKIDLLGRMVVPQEIYNTIKNRISGKAS